MPTIIGEGEKTGRKRGKRKGRKEKREETVQSRNASEFCGREVWCTHRPELCPLRVPEQATAQLSFSYTDYKMREADQMISKIHSHSTLP